MKFSRNLKNGDGDAKLKIFFARPYSTLPSSIYIEMQVVPIASNTIESLLSTVYG